MKKPRTWTNEEWRLFQVFCTSNKSAPHHPIDCNKWNYFVVEAHKQSSKLKRDDVYNAMIKSNWSNDWAANFADCFEEYQDLLSMYDKNLKMNHAIEVVESDNN